jgi:predicted DNA-binding transcriptional regulator AlpA
MQTVTFTQLTESEIRAVIRSELETFFADHQLAASQPDPDQIGGIELALQITGLAKPTIYGLVAQSKIPHMKRGKLLYFSKRELTDWIKQGRRKTAADIEAAAETYLSNREKCVHSRQK